MIAAAQTKPEDAISNLGGWLKLAGVDHVPAFLNTLQADVWLTALGGLVALASAGVLIGQWWQRDTPSSQPSAISEGVAVPPWTPLDDAIRYLAKGSQWGAAQKRTDSHFPIRLSIELRDALLCGDLSARGRQYHVLKGGIQDPPLHSLKPIEKEFWDGVHIESYFPLQGRVQSIASKGVESAVRKGDHEGMHDIRIDTRQLLALWPAQSATSPSRNEESRKRELIEKGRDLAHGFTDDHAGQGFRSYLEGHRSYADIRPHLSSDYLKKLNAHRTLYAKADGAKYPALVSWFLDDLDRLEKEWGLI